MAQATMLDIAKINSEPFLNTLIEINLTYAPELSVVPARTIKGTSYRTVYRDTFPGVGFRLANQGSPYTKSTLLNKLHECFIFSGNIRADVAVMKADERGPEHWKSMEASGMMKQAMIEIGQQFYYGISTDANGFPGLQAFHAAFSTELTAAGVANPSIAPLTIDAGGTTALTGSSVYGVKFGDDGLQFIFGNDSTITLSEWFFQMVNDGTANRDYLAECASMNSWIGLQAGNPYCIARIKNITADSGKTLTDALGFDLLAKCPVGFVPDVWFMTRRSLRQLQSSRSIVTTSGVSQRTNAAIVGGGGREITADLPNSMCGIPIQVTDSLTNTEAIA